MPESRGETTTVRFFEQLYAVVVGLGLALAVEQVLDFGDEGVSVATEHLLLFLAYLNFAFPLAHASVRYLDLAYIDRSIGPLGKGRVLHDLALGTGHFLFLITLSFVIASPTAFTLTAIALLVGRPGRDALLALTGRPRLEFDRVVVYVHLITILVLLAVLGVAQVVDPETEQWVLRIGSLVASFVFALGLYLGAFSFFFPSTD